MARKALFSTGLPVLVLFITGCAAPAMEEDVKTGQHAQVFERIVQADGEAPRTRSGRYLLYLPEDYPKSRERWPLMLFLHGAGERGEDLERVKIHGPPGIVEKKNDFPFILVSPQCPDGVWWSVDYLKALLDEVVVRYRVDEERIYLTGLSMGGFGTWQFAVACPHRFAAIAPICGGGPRDKAVLIKEVPAWVFHGAKDPVVPLKSSKEMVEALKACGGDVRFTVYPEAGHDSWTATYDNPELYEWFLKHRRVRGAGDE